jgi:hypothetical protein
MCKKLNERAMEQVTDEQLCSTLDEGSNSIGIIVNLRRTICGPARPILSRPTGKD